MKSSATAASLIVAGFAGGLCATSLVDAAPVSGAAPLAGQETVTTNVTVPTFATSDSNGSMIAVTGVDITGSSVLYLIDTEARQMACYQASGGSSSTQGIKLVGARCIDLDLQLDGYKDKSDYTYRQLESEFASLDAAGE